MTYLIVIKCKLSKVILIYVNFSNKPEGFMVSVSL